MFAFLTENECKGSVCAVLSPSAVEVGGRGRRKGGRWGGVGRLMAPPPRPEVELQLPAQTRGRSFCLVQLLNVQCIT